MRRARLSWVTVLEYLAALPMLNEGSKDLKGVVGREILSMGCRGVLWVAL